MTNNQKVIVKNQLQMDINQLKVATTSLVTNHRIANLVQVKVHHLRSRRYNKLFKIDSQRVVFLLCVAFSVSGGMR